MNTLEIHCKKCSGLIPESAIDWDAEMATCEDCGQFQTITDMRKYRVAKPSSIDEQKQENELHFRVRNHPFLGLIYLLAGIITLTVGLVLLFHPTLQVHVGLQLGVVAFGLALISLSILAFANQIHIIANDESLITFSSLIPLSVRTLKREDIDQLFVHEIDIRQQSGDGDSFGSYTQSAFTIYILKVSFKKGGQKSLTRWITREQGWYLERELERFLGLDDWDH